MIRKISALLTALLLVTSLPLAALADTWNLDDGNITVSASESGQTVQQGTSDAVTDNDPTITGGSGKETITVTTTGEAQANLTIKDVDAKTIDVGESNATITVSGESNKVSDGIHVSSGDLTIAGDGTLEVGRSNNGAAIGSNAKEDMSGSITITENASVTINPSYDGNSYNCAGIGSGFGGNMSGEITIQESVSVNVSQGSGNGAAIGSGSSGAMSGEITIQDSAVVDATGSSGAGIGSGQDGAMSGDITIQDNANVTSNGKNGAGIGSGLGVKSKYSLSGTITIQGSATVNATATSGAAIGSGSDGNMAGNITIDGNANVTASTSHTDDFEPEKSKPGAGIGSGSGGEMSGTINIGVNADVKATANSKDGAIGAGTNGTVTETGSINLNWQPKPTEPEPTVPEPTEPEPSEPEPTEPEPTEPEPTEPKPTEPEFTQPEAKGTAIYQMLNEDSVSVGYTSTVKDGVLTITVKGDYACLTGTVASLKLLASWGYKAITLVTDNATSTFALADLIAKAPGTYALTHSGKEAALTLNGEALTGILK